MESLSDTKWDVVISGTGLSQSLLALALSRSGKNILHVDDNEFYGGSEAAFSLQEVDEWAEKLKSLEGDGVFTAVEVIKDDEGLSFSRAYSLALAPQLIHTKSELLSQLVSSKAFRQVEFLAVGSFYIYQPSSESEPQPSLSRIPSTREDVFSNTAIPARAKRSLMKFLKFVLEYDAEPQTNVWKPRAEDILSDFLASEFKLDSNLQSYILALTLSLDGKITVGDGLAAINRHMSSMGLFGAGFAAVYPKWGGLSEVAQVGCRAGAVGGTVYMLGTGIRECSSGDELDIKLANDMVIKSKTLVQASEAKASEGIRLSKLTAVLNSALIPVFEVVMDGAPTPAVAVVAFPPGSILTEAGEPSTLPVYAMVHSSDTGECPSGQCVIYLSTISTSDSKSLLRSVLSSLLTAVAGDGVPAKCLYQLYYEQRATEASTSVDGNIVRIPSPSVDLAFNDSLVEQVRTAWDAVTSGDEADDSVEYMQFEDREGPQDDDPYS